MTNQTYPIFFAGALFLVAGAVAIIRSDGEGVATTAGALFLIVGIAFCLSPLFS